MSGYRCGICKKSVKFDVKNIGIQCPYCGSKIFYKERPTIAKHITFSGIEQCFLALCHWEEEPVRLLPRCAAPRAE